MRRSVLVAALASAVLLSGCVNFPWTEDWYRGWEAIDSGWIVQRRKDPSQRPPQQPKRPIAPAPGAPAPTSRPAPEQPRTKPPQGPECGYCGQPVTPGASTCPNCGNNLTP